jgi:hypothetical protein
MYNTPHSRNLKMSFKNWIRLILFIAFMYWLVGCSPCKTGCPSHTGRHRMIGYGQTGFGKPLCPVKNCTYFSGWSSLNGSICACYKHSIDDYKPQDSAIWLPYRKEMEFGY